MPRIYKPRPGPLLRLNFSLKALFVVLTIIGVWLGVQVKWIRDRHDTLEWIRGPGSAFGRTLDAQLATPDEHVVGGYSDWSEALNGLASAPWSLRALGENGVGRIELFGADQVQLAERRREMERLFPEAAVITHSNGP